MDGEISSMMSAMTSQRPRVETVSLTYQKLVVPIKMRSIYWKGFGFPANDKGEILTRQKIVCLFCQTSIAYNRNTSNLRMHLESKHREKLVELEVHEPPPKMKSKYGKRKKTHHSVFEIDTSGSNMERLCETEIPESVLMEPHAELHKVRPIPNTNQQAMIGPNPELVEIVVPNLSPSNGEMYGDETSDGIDSAITEFIVTDLVSPSVVEGSGFKQLLSLLRPGICTGYSCKTKVEDQLLPQCHSALRDSVLEEICGDKPLGVSLEEWKSVAGHNFITISAHFVKEVDEMETRVLSTLMLPTDSKNWTSAIVQVLESWGIGKNRILAVVVLSLQPEQLLDALRTSGLTVLPCLEATIEKSVDKCLKIESIPEVVVKCEALGKMLKPTSLLVDSDDDSEENTEVINSCIWTNIYKLLKKFEQKEQTIKKFCKSQDENIKLTEDDWNLIKTIVEILEPFTIMLTTLDEEKCPSISLVRPFLCQMIYTHLKESENDSDLMSRLKLILREELSDTYSEESTDLLLQTAAFLDPRFKALPLNIKGETSFVIEYIESKLEEMMQDSDAVDTLTIDQKPRLSGIGLLLGNICSPTKNLSKMERAAKEVSQYKSEQAASFDVCPLQWWAATRSKCPKLCQLARNLASIPAMVNPNPSKLVTRYHTKSIFNIRRACIDPEHVDKILFLHANQKLFSFQDS